MPPWAGSGVPPCSSLCQFLAQCSVVDQLLPHPSPTTTGLEAPVDKSHADLSGPSPCVLPGICTFKKVSLSIRPSAVLSRPAPAMVQWGWEGCRGAGQGSKSHSHGTQHRPCCCCFLTGSFWDTTLFSSGDFSRDLSGKFTGTSSDQGPTTWPLWVALRMHTL